MADEWDRLEDDDMGPLEDDPESSTGIYRKRLPRQNATDFTQLPDELHSCEQLARLLDRAASNELLFDDVVDEPLSSWDVWELEAESYIQDHENNKWPSKADREATVQDAECYLFFLHVIREHGMEDQSLCSCMFFLGRLAERLSVREHEFNALTGKKVRAGGSDGRRKAHGDLNKIRTRHREMVDKVAELMRNGLSVDKATRKTAKLFNVSKRTVQRARKKAFEKT